METGSVTIARARQLVCAYHKAFIQSRIVLACLLAATAVYLKAQYNMPLWWVPLAVLVITVIIEYKAYAGVCTALSDLLKNRIAYEQVHCSRVVRDRASELKSRGTLAEQVDKYILYGEDSRPFLFSGRMNGENR